MRWKGGGRILLLNMVKYIANNIVFFPQIVSNLESPILKVNPFIYIVIYIT